MTADQTPNSCAEKILINLSRFIIRETGGHIEIESKSTEKSFIKIGIQNNNGMRFKCTKSSEKGDMQIKFFKLNSSELENFNAWEWNYALLESEDSDISLLINFDFKMNPVTGKRQLFISGIHRANLGPREGQTVYINHIIDQP